jgi:hypothetical protein
MTHSHLPSQRSFQDVLATLVVDGTARADFLRDRAVFIRRTDLPHEEANILIALNGAELCDLANVVTAKRRHLLGVGLPMTSALLARVATSVFDAYCTETTPAGPSGLDGFSMRHGECQAFVQYLGGGRRAHELSGVLALSNLELCRLEVELQPVVSRDDHALARLEQGREVTLVRAPATTVAAIPFDLRDMRRWLNQISTDEELAMAAGASGVIATYLIRRRRNSLEFDYFKIGVDMHDLLARCQTPTSSFELLRPHTRTSEALASATHAIEAAVREGVLVSAESSRSTVAG